MFFLRKVRRESVSVCVCVKKTVSYKTSLVFSFFLSFVLFLLFVCSFALFSKKQLNTNKQRKQQETKENTAV